jgi:2-polyprenyl-6-methoxyphenol hydroxylase-like FAD-dependent oxidoreductase
MQAEVNALIEEGGRVVGLQVMTPAGPLEVRAGLVIGADGRHSVVRDRAGLQVEDLGAPIDVLWFRLSLRPDDPGFSMGRFVSGAVFAMINRGDYWQCGLVVPKGTMEQIRAEGLERFRARVAQLAPFAAGRTGELGDWDQIKLLTVRVDRLQRWYRDGLLCIGDAAHAMSPVGGVGINLAIQDAVAAANLLAAPLRENRLTTAHLADLQRRRALPTRLTQRLQVFVQNRVISRVLGSAAVSAPFALRLFARCAFLRRIPARLVGIGVRPEHVRTASAWPEVG